VTAESKMHTFTIAGLIRNLAPEFIALLASSTFSTVPTCRILAVSENSRKTILINLYLEPIHDASLN
jgi:hypothetical protein